MKFTWKPSRSQFGSMGESLYINKIRVGDYSWSMVVRGEAIKYMGESFLPGQTRKYVYGATPDEVKAKVEQLVTAWFAEVKSE